MEYPPDVVAWIGTGDTDDDDDDGDDNTAIISRYLLDIKSSQLQSRGNSCETLVERRFRATGS